MSVRVTFGKCADRGRVVALVGDADQLAFEAELADDFGGAGEE